MQTTLEREVPAELRPRVHHMAVTNRWLIGAVVVLLLAVIGLGAYAIVQATSDDPTVVSTTGTSLTDVQQNMVDIVEGPYVQAWDQGDPDALTALFTPFGRIHGMTPDQATMRVSDGSLGAFVERWADYDFVAEPGMLVSDNTVVAVIEVDTVPLLNVITFTTVGEEQLISEVTLFGSVLG